MAERRFEFVFDDESDRDRITFEFSDEESERGRAGGSVGPTTAGP